MTMTSEVKLEPTAGEIGGHDIEFLAEMRDVLTAGSAAWQRLDMIIAKLETSRAAILAMDRRASPPAVCDVATMHTSSGIPDHFARVTVGDRLLDFFMSKIKGQAEYHAAELDWLLNGGEKPDILGFDYTEPPGLADYLAARASPPAPAVAVKPLEWDHIGLGWQKAFCEVGTYTVRPDGGWYLEQFDEEFRHIGLSVEAAKAAAQADYEQRIRSALVEPAPAVAVLDAFDLDSVREQRKEDGGLWRTCSGCYETEDGHPVGHYPRSEAFGCTLGAGCSECGGIGAVWDTTNYADMGDYIATCDELPAPAVAVPEGYRAIVNELVFLPVDSLTFAQAMERLRGLVTKAQAAFVAEGTAAAPQPPATRSYEEGKRDGRKEGIEAAAKWHDDMAADFERPVHGGSMIEVAPRHRKYATVIRSLADEPRHGE